MSSRQQRSTRFSSEPLTTADEVGELFGVHIPELQLSIDDYRQSMRAANLTKGERYLELGSGHGHGLLMAAQEFGAIAVGVEYLDSAIEQSLQRAEKAGVAERIEVIKADLRRIDPTSADVIHMHLGPAFHDVLAPRLERFTQPTTRVIAAGWRVPGWRPTLNTEHDWSGGYIYRPGDPRQHLTWHSERAFDGRVELIDATVHADLEAIELRVQSNAAHAPVAVVSCEYAMRGQRLSVAVGHTGAPIEVALWARSRSGRLTQRGATLLVEPQNLRDW